jgi:DNA-3-methyladenine glycosylase II
MTMKRFRIVEDSMRPALVPGDEIVASDSSPSTVGDVVVFPHPEHEDFWLVKRLAEPPEDLGPDRVWVLSDNREVTLADSRSLGPINIKHLMTRVERLDQTTFREGCELLALEDPALAVSIDLHGAPEFWRRPQGFAVLVLLVLEQQVSLESGAAMYRRLDKATGGVTPQQVMALGPDKMRSIGVTRQKTEYLLGLADRVAGDSFDIDGLDHISVPDARAKLIELKGIGPWTADAYLLSALRHIDMWPVGDRALQVGAGELLGMESAPTEDELEIIGEPWRPLRAVAARIIWHAYLTERDRTEPPDPTLARTSLGDA